MGGGTIDQPITHDVVVNGPPKIKYEPASRWLIPWLIDSSHGCSDELRYADLESGCTERRIEFVF